MSNTSADLMTNGNCGEGEVIGLMFNQMSKLAYTYYGSISGICMILVSVWATMWMAYRFAELATGNPPDSKQVIDEVIGIVVAEVFLNSPQTVWDVVSAIVTTGGFAAGKIYAVAGGGTPKNFAELACYGLNSIDVAMMNPLNVMSGGLGWSVKLFLLFIPLFIAVSFLMLKILKFSVFPAVKTYAILMMAPFVVAMIAIGPLKRAAFTAMKTLIVNAFELILVAAVVAVIVSMVTGTVSAQKNGILDITLAQDWLGGNDYFQVFAMVLILYYSFDALMGIPSLVMELINSQMQSARGALTQGVRAATSAIK